MTDQRITELEAELAWLRARFVEEGDRNRAESQRWALTYVAEAAAKREVARLRGVVQAVEALHRPMRMMSEMGGATLCEECVVPFPCSTAAAAAAAAEGLPLPTEPQSRTWHGPDCPLQPDGKCAELAVAWVNANGGQARSIVATGGGFTDTDAYEAPRIALRTPDDEFYAKPGDTIVMAAPGEFRAVPTDEDTR